MITLLAKLFIKKKPDKTDDITRRAYGVLCGCVGIFLNIVLFTGKFIAGTISNSIAITADAFNNLSDAGSSFITLIGFKLAGAKPDPGHPFGHGRIEYISGLVVSGVILVMGVELIRDSIDKIMHPSSTEFNFLTIIILVTSILVKIYMSVYNSRLGKKLSSGAMRATAMDSLSDTCATLVVLIATIISHFTGIQIDGYCGVLVGLFILYAGFSSARDMLNPLLGQPPQDSFVNQIEDIVMSHKTIIGIHDLIVHDYGPGRLMVSLHAEVPAEGNVLELHDLIDNIENDLKRELNCAAVIHMDPVVTKDEKVSNLKDAVLKIINDIDSSITMHDFRVVLGPTHTNLIFDIVIPFKYKTSDNELIELISQRTKEVLGNNHFCVIEVDKAYIN